MSIRFSDDWVEGFRRAYEMRRGIRLDPWFIRECLKEADLYARVAEEDRSGLFIPRKEQTVELVCGWCGGPTMWGQGEDGTPCKQCQDRGVVKVEISSVVATVRETLVKMATPYTALLMDTQSRRWIAPSIWNAMEEAVGTALRYAKETPPFDPQV